MLVVVGGLLAHSAPALAAFNETWVSPNGNDSSTNCAITAPCKTFAGAHTKTNNSGAINVLTAGNFGPVTITKAISIVADGVEAVINTAAASGAAITINACGGCKISLRGLTIDLISPTASTTGISFVAGGALHVHNSVIRRSDFGILFAPPGVSELYVSDSVVENFGQAGIEVNQAGSGSAKVMLNHVRVENGSGIGISLVGANTTGSIKAMVRDSVMSGNGGNGILAFEGGSGTTNVMVDRSASVNNSTGLHAFGAGATIRIGDSTVTGNGSGLMTSSSGVIYSYGTNKVNGNNADGAPTSTIPYK